jgi:hypothetical protein
MVDLDNLTTEQEQNIFDKSNLVECSKMLSVILYNNIGKLTFDDFIPMLTHMTHRNLDKLIAGGI